MSIRIKKHQADWIAEQVSSGRYASRAEAIEDALGERMRADEVAWKADGEALRERLSGSERQMERGEVVEADDAFFARKRRMIRDRFMKPGQ